MAGFTSIKDMFDGGGAGRSGQTFQGGGALSDMANRVARPMGYADRERAAGREPTSYFRDIRDGGGMGRSGANFEGAGAYSGLLNFAGVRPAGYQGADATNATLGQQLAEIYAMRRQPQPAAAPAMTGATVPPVTVSTLPPVAAASTADIRQQLIALGILPPTAGAPVSAAMGMNNTPYGYR